MPRVAVLAVVATLLTAASAQAKVTLRIAPSAPRVGDDVTVSWRTDRALKPGYRYQAVLDGGTGPSDCVNQVTKRSARRPAKGRPMSFTFHPSEDVFEDMGAWCAGPATVRVTMVRAKPRAVIAVGTLAFRFRR